MQPQIIADETLHAGAFLRFSLVRYRDASGTPRSWEAVQRRHDAHAAVIVALTSPGDELVLIRQFRPPLQSFALEFPAGIIDVGEDAAATAMRELREETGFRGTVRQVLPAAAASAGLTGEKLTLVIMTIDPSLPDNVRPAPDFQEGESIQMFKVPLAGLADFLRERVASGDVPDSRLVAWTHALSFRR